MQHGFGDVAVERPGFGQALCADRLPIRTVANRVVLGFAWRIGAQMSTAKRIIGQALIHPKLRDVFCSSSMMQ